MLVTIILLLGELAAGYWFVSYWYRPLPLARRLLSMAGVAIGTALLLGVVARLLTGDYDPLGEWNNITFLVGAAIRVIRELRTPSEEDKKKKEVLSAEAAGNSETL